MNGATNQRVLPLRVLMKAFLNLKAQNASIRSSRRRSSYRLRSGREDSTTETSSRQVFLALPSYHRIQLLHLSHQAQVQSMKLKDELKSLRVDPFIHS